jgi:hypothetical protein
LMAGSKRTRPTISEFSGPYVGLSAVEARTPPLRPLPRFFRGENAASEPGLPVTTNYPHPHKHTKKTETPSGVSAISIIDSMSLILFD